MAIPVSRDDGTFDPVYRPNGLTPEAVSRPSGWARRAGARLLDTLIIVFPGYLAVAVLVQGVMGLPVTLAEDSAAQTSELMLGDVVASFLMFGLWIAYETFFVSHRGQTPGKMLLGIKVIPVNEDTVPLGVDPATAARRAVLLNIVTAAAWAPSPIVFVLNMFVLLAVLWPLWDRPYHQGLHDKIVRTRVVRVAPPRFGSPEPGPGWS